MINCAQCEQSFLPKSVANIYCSTPCRWDASNGRDSAQSKNRRESGFAWDPVCRARRVDVKCSPSRPRKASDWATAVILPDPQFGYRRLTTGVLDPFHDARALDIAMQIVEAERPDLTVWLGDYLDLASFGRYRQEEAFAQTVQPAIEVGHEYLARTVSLSTEVRLIEGNHDARLQNFITDNALVAAGLRRAKEPPESWPVLSVPFLLRMEELGVEYVGGYPSGATYLNDNLACVHGHVVAPAGMTAPKVAGQEQVSMLFGHVHRIEAAYTTRNSRGRPRFNTAQTPGCLCRIDGAVPSVKSAPALKTGKPVKSWENWQQGLAVVRYETGGLQRFNIEMVPIFEGFAMHRGVEYTSDLAVDAG